MASHTMPALLALIPILMGLVYGLYVRSWAISLIFGALLMAAALIILAIWLTPASGVLL